MSTIIIGSPPLGIAARTPKRIFLNIFDLKAEKVMFWLVGEYIKISSAVWRSSFLLSDGKR